MNKYTITLLATILLSISLNIYLFKNFSSKSEDNSNIPWPSESNWQEIESDKTIPVKYTESNMWPMIEFDCKTGTITGTKHSDSIIAWKDEKYLMIVSYGPISSGCNLTRIDTGSNSIVYYARLNGMGPIDHSQYGNRVRVYKNEDLIMIVGDEAAGDYREIRRISNGSLILVNQNFKNFNSPPFINIKNGNH